MKSRLRLRAVKCCTLISLKIRIVKYAVIQRDVIEMYFRTLEDVHEKLLDQMFDHKRSCSVELNSYSSNRYKKTT